MSEEEPLAYAVDEAARRLGVGRSTLWKHIASGRVPVLRLGGRTLVTRAAIEALLAEGELGAQAAPPRPLRRMRMT